MWTQLASLGEVERGFAVFRDEVWVFARRGPYAAVATAGPACRPGLILDHLDQVLLVAEEARARRSTAVRPQPERDRDRDREREHEAPRGLRTPLHRDPRPTVSPAEPAAAGHGTSRPAAGADPALRPAVNRPVADRASPASSEPPSSASDASADGAESDDVWVDHVALAREFRGLFQQDKEQGP